MEALVELEEERPAMGMKDMIEGSRTKDGQKGMIRPEEIEPIKKDGIGATDEGLEFTIGMFDPTSHEMKVREITNTDTERKGVAEDLIPPELCEDLIDIESPDMKGVSVLTGGEEEMFVVMDMETGEIRGVALVLEQDGIAKSVEEKITERRDRGERHVVKVALTKTKGMEFINETKRRE